MLLNNCQLRTMKHPHTTARRSHTGDRLTDRKNLQNTATIRFDLTQSTASSHWLTLSCSITEALHSSTTDDYQLMKHPHAIAHRSQTQQNQLASAMHQTDIRHLQQQALTDQQLKMAYCTATRQSHHQFSNGQFRQTRT